MMATAQMEASGPAVVEARGSAVVARERIALAAGAALLGAGLILVVAVLPAEYGVDPLGIGRRLGLTAMNDTARRVEAFTANRAGAAAGVTIVAPKDRQYKQETVEFKLAPGESVEYKYRLDKGDALLYSWKATSRVNYDLHAEPDGAPRGYAETYDKKDAQESASGTLTVPFSGIHGWYWENKGDKEATVTLSAAGFYNMSHEFRKDQQPKTKIFQ
jgi:hypothetical protein